MLSNSRQKRADETEERLETLRIAERREIDDIAYYSTHEFLTPENVRSRTFEPCSIGFTWNRERETDSSDRRTATADVVSGHVSTELEVGRNIWFRLRFIVPHSMEGRPVYLRFIARPRDGDDGLGSPRVESLCFRDGIPWQAFDNGHESLRLTDSADGGEQFDLLVEAGTTTLWGKLDIEEFILQTAEIYAERPVVADLHRHVSICNDLQKQFDEQSPNRGRLLNALMEASHAFPFDETDRETFRKGAERALKPLERVEEKLSSDLATHQLTAVGHAHIDLAWLWPWSETVRKGGRSFSNVLQLMDDYPSFTFMQSQPHLYEWVQNRYPAQFETIKDRIAEGRWHPEGALWVESDINNAGPESLARQFLLGKRYFREEFDVDPKVTFIPDVFGYSAGLPGIADAADCPYFLTQKMSWSEINEFPHNTFRWEGIDGSEVLAHFPPADDYNGKMTVEEVTRSVYNDAQNACTDDRAYLVGYGDGGGGPTREMVERSELMNDIEALPDIEWGSLAGLFERLDSDREDYPKWTGELYLEKHRGTLTSQARTKRNNRKGEYALREAELWSSLALALSDEPYPYEDLTRAWKILLFNQFHDILPGSSVTDVYADADRDYAEMFEMASNVRRNALAHLINPERGAKRVCLTNALSWKQRSTGMIAADAVSVQGDDLVAVPDGVTKEGNERFPIQQTTAGIGDDLPSGTDAFLINGVEVPAFGATSAEIGQSDRKIENPLEASKNRLSNGSVTVEFDDDGTVSIVDEEVGRTVLVESGNRLMLYRDQPHEWDAWDVDEDVYAVGDQLPAPETTIVESGPVRATVHQTRSFGDSELKQAISLYRDSKHVEFRTMINWQEEEKLLKTHFPADVAAKSATYDTHFGHHERATHNNTTWDQAQYEEPGGQWVDLSEPRYGVALLNDCKYGVHVDGTDISLSLLRAPNNPDPEADRGTHEFTYTLYPHTGDHVDAKVNQIAYEQNAESRVLPISDPVSMSPVDIDPDGIVVEALKRGEERDDELIMRLYESEGRHTDATVDLHIAVASVSKASLIEDTHRELDVNDDQIELTFEPFEIKTIAIRLAS